MKKLYRSRKNRILAGVCGGLGEYFNIDPVIIRLIFIFFSIMVMSGVLIYLIAWFIIPTRPKKASETTVDINPE